jgi:heme oxygenase
MSTNSASHVGLAKELKLATSAIHNRADSHEFINWMLGKESNKMTAETYLLYLVQFQAVYNALEEGLVQPSPATHMWMNGVVARSPGLASDIAFFEQQAGDIDVPILPNTQAYVDKLNALAENEPYCLVAHAYTRYLGDLFGGQIMARYVKKQLNLDGEGLEFYKFHDLPNARSFVHEYRNKLDEIGSHFTPEEKQKVLEEAVLAFEMNIGILDDVLLHEKKRLGRARI